MIAAAVAAVGLGASALESANVVGYQSQSAASKPALTGGMAFRTTGASDKTFKLNDIALSGSTYGADWIGFVNPTTSALDSSKNVTYYTPAESIADYGDASYAGWYDITDADKGDVTYPCGTAFLANFTSPNVTVTYAGEVLKGENTVNCAGKPAAFVANLYPGNITMNQVTLTGSTYGADWIGFVNATSSAVDSSRNLTYYTAAESAADYAGDTSYAGWYDITDTDKGDVVLNAGDGFLCNFTSPSVTVTFPTALAE